MEAFTPFTDPPNLQAILCASNEELIVWAQADQMGFFLEAENCIELSVRVQFPEDNLFIFVFREQYMLAAAEF